MSRNILVINLTRFGDLLQMQGLADDLSIAGYSVSLVCLENFAEGAKYLRNVVKVWAFPGARLLAGLHEGWPAALGKLMHFVKQIEDETRPGYVLNLTASLPGRLLARLFAKQNVEFFGFGVDENGYSLNHGAWVSFASASALKRGNASFNLSDMFRKMAVPLSGGLKGKSRLKNPPQEAMTFAADFLKTHSPENAKGFIAFQLGASEDRRRWPVSHFAELGRMLWEKDRLCPVILGSLQEQNLALRYNSATPFINAAGKTDLMQLGAILKHTRLLVTNDTGTMHLAAGLDIPSLSFFLATAQPWDTGPLLEGCCCLEPALDCHPCQFSAICTKNRKCRQFIEPAPVASLILAWLKDGSWQKGITDKLRQQARVWLTVQDADGLTRLKPIALSGGNERSYWLEVMRLFWSHFFGAMEHVAKEKNILSFKDSFLPDKSGIKSVLNTINQIIELLTAIHTYARLVSANPKAAQFLLRNCERLQTVLNECPVLDSVAVFWRDYRRSQDADIESFILVAECLAFSMQYLKDILEKE